MSQILLCRKGLHPKTVENTGSKGRCKICRNIAENARRQLQRKETSKAVDTVIMQEKITVQQSENEYLQVTEEIITVNTTTTKKEPKPAKKTQTPLKASLVEVIFEDKFTTPLPKREEIGEEEKLRFKKFMQDIYASMPQPHSIACIDNSHGKDVCCKTA